jgi:heme a synthase
MVRAIRPSSMTQILDRRRAIRLWLLSVAALIFAMVLVGGATRLTESGLSIVEWKPVTGTVPPLSEAAWQAEFDKYKAIPQYREVNRGMTLAEFKTIFWWEWTHRLTGRLIGVAFLLPFLFFLWKGWVEPGLRARLCAIFGLGALQGAIGWWMVASGLTERVNVSQYRLAVHLTLACLIFAAVLWTALRLVPREPVEALPRIRAGACVVLGLVFVQIYLGALVAGLRAGLTYNTWPLIDGAFIPDSARLWFEQPLWRNFFENALTVQFMHRMTAYALLVVVVLHAVDVARTLHRGRVRAWAWTLAVGIVMQAAIGILTLLHQVPIGLGLAHQGMAMVVLTITVLHTESLVMRRLKRPVGRPIAV